MGHVDVVNTLIKHGAEIDAHCGQEEFTALMEPIRSGQLEVVRALVNSGADVNATASFGVPPLLLAAGAGQLEVVTTFLERRADVNGRDGQGNTALLYAARAGNMEIVRALLAQGADVNATDHYDSDTSLIIAQDLSGRRAERDSFFRQLGDVDPTFYVALFLFIALVLVVGGFLYAKKRLVQRIRMSGSAHLARDRFLVIAVHILAWLFLTAMYVANGEGIPALWGSRSLAAAVLAILFGAVALFVLFAFSLANSLSSQAYAASHRKTRWILFAVLLLVGFAIAMFLTGNTLRGFSVLGTG